MIFVIIGWCIGMGIMVLVLPKFVAWLNWRDMTPGLITWERILEKDTAMIDPLVMEHLILTHDEGCDNEGHELISRACIHCGLTIHQISDANGGVLPIRDSPSGTR